MDELERAVAVERLEPADLPVPFGRFTITQVLGAGGMARVFRAEMGSSFGVGKPVALKVLRPMAPHEGRERVRDLRTEARIGAALRHRNIVETYDIGEENGQPFIALEFVDGLTLQQLLEDGGPPPHAVMLEIAQQIAAGLHAAHRTSVDGQELGLVHRDLKPANVMIDRQGVVKLMDFGVAKSRRREWNGTTTQLGRVKGTPMYMSPEQARGLSVDARSDLFPLGAILYELVTGHRLFVGTSIPSVLMRVMCVEGLLEQDAEFLLLRREQPKLAAVIARCLRVRPQERFESAGEVAKQLLQVKAKTSGEASLAALVSSILDGHEDETPTGRLPILLDQTWPEPGVVGAEPAQANAAKVANAAAMATTLVGRRSEAVRNACGAAFTDPDISFFDLPTPQEDSLGRPPIVLRQSQG